MSRTLRIVMAAVFAVSSIVFIAGGAWAWGPERKDDYKPVMDYVNMITRKRVSCEKVLGPRTMVALVFGQSNSANAGWGRYTPKHDVYVYYDGKCYQGMDPLPGTNGTGGTVWSRLGDKVIEGGLYDKVLFIACGVGGTSMNQWTPTGELYPRVLDALASLKAANITITHILWHQGENDNGAHTKKDDYKKMFMAMVDDIRKHGVDAPIYVAVATRCGGNQEGFEIQQAQRELVNTTLGIYPGAFSDELTSIDDRPDSCHFTASGLDKHANLWFNAIKYSGK